MQHLTYSGQSQETMQETDSQQLRFRAGLGVLVCAMNPTHKYPCCMDRYRSQNL